MGFLCCSIGPETSGLKVADGLGVYAKHSQVAGLCAVVADQAQAVLFS